MQIQPQLRAQINSLGMARAELTAQEEINGYLTARYDTSAEFTDTGLYSSNTTYSAASRVYISYPAYVPATSYVPGNYVTNGNNAYICTGDTTGTFDPTKWTAIGPASTIYYAAFPCPVFNVYRVYAIGDKVFWKNHTYTCKAATVILSDFEALQYHTENNIPLHNIFPDDQVNGASYWTDNGIYTVAPNTLTSAQYDPTATYAQGAKVTYTNNVYICTTAITEAEPFDATNWALYWVLGDNRSQLMVTHMINIALYWAHYSIAPNNVPADRKEGYTLATAWCERVRDGINATPLPEKEPNKGRRILFDSEVKRGNGY